MGRTRHVFFTGEIQVGKSTALRGAVSRLGWPCGGFQTVFTRRGTAEARLCLCPWGDARCLPERTVALYAPGRGMAALPGDFDRLGPPLLAPAPGTKLLVLDELGYLEREAEGFRRAVLAVLTRGEGRLPPPMAAVGDVIHSFRDDGIRELLPDCDGYQYLSQ